MHTLPSWYSGVIEFGYVFHSLFDLLFVVIGFLTIAVVSRPGWRHHLRWANPAAAAAVLQGLGRLAMDLHHYFGIGARLNVYLTSDVFNYLAVILSFYSTLVLWRMLRDLARHSHSPDAMALHPPQPGVWPPPPTMPTTNL